MVSQAVVVLRRASVVNGLMCVLTRYNQSGPGGVESASRSLTHSSDLSREGLAMDATRIPQRVIDRALSNVDIDPERGCWVSRYSVGSHGYAQIGWGIPNSRRSKMMLVHRVAYVARRGPIADGMTVDHMCKQRRCCNPDHLRLLSNFENARRTAGRDWPLGQCINGHPNSNLRTAPDGTRVCRVCSADWQRRYRAGKDAS